MANKVFVSGIFDLLHSGHIEFFKQAAKFGDLFVAVGSDQTALDLAKGTMAWQVVHGETPDAIRNHPLLKGVTIPRTGQ